MRLLLNRVTSIDTAFLGLVVTTLLAIGVSVICLLSGIVIVFQNIFYVPIIIACVYYSRKGLYYSIFLAFVYLILIFMLTDGYLIELPALIRAASFIIIAAVISFLSERIKQHQGELTRSREQYRALVGNIPGVSYRCLVDEEWTMEFISKEITRLTGYPVADFIDNAVRSYGSIIHPEDRPYIKRTIFEASARKQGYEIEYRIISSDNRIIWVLEKGKGITNAEGNLEWLDGVIIDITRQKKAEQALKASQEKYRSITENSFDMISLVDINGKFIYCNQTYKQILGYTPDELAGKSVFDLIHPQQRASAQKELQEGLRKGKEEESLVYRLLSKDGTQVVVDNRVRVISRQEGVPHQLLIIGVDITEKVKALAELQRVYEDYERVFQGSHDAIFLAELTNNNNFKYLKTNKAHQEATGFSLEKISGKTPHQLLGDEMGEKIAANYLRCVEGEKPVTYEEELELPGGKKTWLTTLNPVIRDKYPSYIVGTSKDISDRKIAEQALQESEARYRKLAENITDIYFALDLNLNTLYVSPSVKKLWGETADEAINKSVSEKFPPQALAKVKAILREELERDKDPHVDKNRSRIIETELYRNDGSIAYVSSHVSFLRDKEGKPTGIQGITRDITERKKAEKELQYRHSFHNLLTDLASNFLKTGAASLDIKINEALQKLGQFFGVDRCYISTYNPQRNTLSNIYEWCKGGVDSFSERFKNICCSSIPWLCKQLKMNNYVLIEKDKLPADAVKEKDIWLHPHWKNLLAVPMIVKNKPLGFIGFESVKQKKEWDDLQIELISVSVKVITETMHRNKLEEMMLKTEQKNTALAMVVTANHQLNQPLMVIQGQLELLKNKLNDPGYEKYFNKIDKAAERIAATLESLKKIDEVEFTNYTKNTNMVKLPEPDK